MANDSNDYVSDALTHALGSLSAKTTDERFEFEIKTFKPGVRVRLTTSPISGTILELPLLGGGDSLRVMVRLDRDVNPDGTKALGGRVFSGADMLIPCGELEPRRMVLVAANHQDGDRWLRENVIRKDQALIVCPGRTYTMFGLRPDRMDILFVEGWRRHNRGDGMARMSEISEMEDYLRAHRWIGFTD